MKKIFLCLMILLFALPAFAADLTYPYTPTQEEWLKLNLEVKSYTFQRVYNLDVAYYFEGDNINAFVTLPDEATDKEKEDLKYVVKSQTESLINTYDWAKEIKVTITDMDELE
ncbi:hypothetical protein ACFLZ2_02030 [Candidatus Margulisiibacteriota bacterium]